MQYPQIRPAKVFLEDSGTIKMDQETFDALAETIARIRERQARRSYPRPVTAGDE